MNAKVSYSGLYRKQASGQHPVLGDPLAIFFIIWRYAMRGWGPGYGVMSFSKSKANSLRRRNQGNLLRMWPESMKPRKSSRKWWSSLKTGNFRSWGQDSEGGSPPGASAPGRRSWPRRSREAGFPSSASAGRSIVEMFVGVARRGPRPLLQATSHAPCIIFIDELGRPRQGPGAST